MHYGEIKDDLEKLDGLDLMNDGQFLVFLLRVLHSIAYDLNSIAYTFRKPEDKKP